MVQVYAGLASSAVGEDHGSANEAFRPRPRRPRLRPVLAVSYDTGTGFGGSVWLVVALLFLVVASVTSGVLSDVFWALAGLFGLMAVVLLGAYISGHGRGGWTRNP